MNGRPFLLALLISSVMTGGASAAVAALDLPSGGRLESPADLIHLAQAREVEIYYDRYGREVLVDVYTGEVLSIREPRGSVRRFEEVRPPAPREQDRYYLDDPDDVARLRREKRMEELGRAYPPVERLPDYRDFRALPDPVLPPRYEDYDDQFAREDPWYGERRPDQPPASRVERAPLDGSSVVELPPVDGVGRIIDEQPRTGALPDATQQPEISHDGASEDVAKIQVLLDRAGASPGVIDGRMGDNVNKAISAYRELTGEALRTYDKDYIEKALAETGGDAFITYEITDVDVAGPYVASVPADYGEKARLERLSFTSVPEMLAERFHMDEKYLRALNGNANFDRPGTLIKVANPGAPKTGTVTRIVADKGRKQVRAYDASGRLVANYPSTIGSSATPSPTGTHTIERIAVDPEYTYNPKINFKQGDNDQVLTIPPGPNGPVGTIWIALSKPTYGIHGTPDPSKIGKTESNGCVRLTNWDAAELAKMVTKGVTVEFVE
jgi:lipoprotein-anchoring transpeptidase ErfK/SrfK